ncbi:MAG: glutamine synthetase family protein [Gammaproteobacteria bacterium]|nr:glutamine synthetase family protein [Gammaproteobacteria bacterium]
MADRLKMVTQYLREHPETSHLDVLVIDLCGNAIGKRLPANAIESVFAKGTPVCGAMQLVDVMGNTEDPMGYGFSDGDPDAFALPIAGSLCPVPWLTGHKSQVLCEFSGAGDGKPLWYEPRQVLKKVLQRFAELNVSPRLAVELEFYLIDAKREDGGAPLAAASPRTGLAETGGRVLSLDKLDEFEPVLGAIEGACRIQNIPTTSMISEYGAGQFEVNLQHQDDPVLAADHAALLRRAVQGVSRARGFDATFMSKPFADQSGNGMHIHLSLVDDDGNNLFDPGYPKGDSNLRQAVAGLQATMAEAMAIFAPNLNVYRRFKPDEFVPVTTDWGDNNRSVAFRIPPSDAANRRIEHRVSGAEANPYLVVAAVLAGVHYGLTKKLDPGDKHCGNAGAEADAELPLKIWQALAAIRESRILPDYLGSDYLKIYADVKQAEFEAFMDGIHPREYQWYL